LRFPDFLKTAVLLFGGAATVLAIVAILGATRDEDETTVYIAAAWWTLAVVVGLWLGRRPQTTEGIGRMMTDAKNQTALPELRPGSIVINRLWLLGLVTVIAGAVAFVAPQVPAILAGYCIGVALTWRRQALAVEAVEGRDGVRYYVEPGAAFSSTKLIRTPGFRRIEPV
jgi:uncharacterized membrane protein HdeD (DUF308 family)